VLRRLFRNSVLSRHYTAILPTRSGDTAGRTPAAILQTRDDNARTGLARKHEAGLEDSEDGETCKVSGWSVVRAQTLAAEQDLLGDGVERRVGVAGFGYMCE
jgi:hypothetical protein